MPRTTLRSRVDDLTASLRLLAIHVTGDRRLACRLCGASRRLTSVEMETDVQTLPDPHESTCILTGTGPCTVDQGS